MPLNKVRSECDSVDLGPFPRKREIKTVDKRKLEIFGGLMQDNRANNASE